jgi:hypothetical protein
MHILSYVSQRSSSRDPNPFSFVGEALALGAVASAAGLVASAMGKPERSVVVGGIDLSSVDLSRPFWVDFSVRPHASPETKTMALRRLRFAADELERIFPNWMCEADVQVRTGRMVLSVVPLQQPAHQVIARALAPVT